MFSLLVDDVCNLHDVSYAAAAAAGADLRKVGPPQNRSAIADAILEEMARPFEPDDAREYDLDRWARKNVEAMARHEDDDPNRVYGAAPTAGAAR